MLKQAITIMGFSLPLLLAGCWSGNHHNANSPRQDLPDITAGAHAVFLSGDADGDSGFALVGSNGKSFVLLANDSNQPAAVVYQRDEASKSWQRVPDSGTHTLQKKLDTMLDKTVPILPKRPQADRALVSDNLAAFSLASDGTITPGNSLCRVNGKIGQNTNVFRTAKLNFNDCNETKGQYSGVAFVDPDAPNAAFRVVVDNGSTIQDFYVFPY